MTKVNLYLWSRLTSLDLAHLAVSVGNAALAVRTKWPVTGEGRQVKANSEKIARLLEGTHDRRDPLYQIETLEAAMKLFVEIRDNDFYKTDIAPRKYTKRNGEKSDFSASLSEVIGDFNSFVGRHKPALLKRSKVSETPKTEAKNDLTAFDKDLPLKIGDLTPDQQAGPLQFEFRDGTLRVRRQFSSSDQGDKSNIKNARTSLQEDSRNLLNNLVETNCDPRLISLVQELKDVLDSDSDIIRLGLIKYTCDNLFSGFVDELPSVTSARFMGLLTGISLYVGQFPDWQRFLENAARSEYEDGDAARTYEVGKAILPALRKAEGLVDPEVPKSLELVIEALQNPKLSVRRALFGAVRTLENLISAMLSEFAKLLSDVSKGARVGAKSATAAIVGSLLFVAAADAAVKLSPTAERVLGTSWMSKAGELVQKAIKDG